MNDQTLVIQKVEREVWTGCGSCHAAGMRELAFGWQFQEQDQAVRNVGCHCKIVP